MSAKQGLQRVDPLKDIPRRAFIKSSDVFEHTSTRTIPSRAAVRAVLSMLRPLGKQHRVLMVGAGSGYMVTVLSRLVGELVVVEHHPEIVEIAQANAARYADDNITFRVGEGALGVPEKAPFDMILVICQLATREALIEQLAEQGEMLFLEQAEGVWAALKLLRRDANGHAAVRDAGVIPYDRDVGDTLFDFEVVDRAQLDAARLKAAKAEQPLLTVLQQAIGKEDVGMYRAIAKRMGLGFDSADNIFAQMDKSLFRKFSRAFLDHYRLVPIALRNNRLMVATDDPEATTTAIAAVMPSGGVDRVLVTPTDYRRLWSAINLIDKSVNQPVPEQRDVEEEVDLDSHIDDGEHNISPYLVAMYESILFDAISERASDIHIERYHQRVRVRLRIDGELTDLEHYTLTPAEMLGVVNVIKTRAELNIAEKRLPQGGRARLRVGAVTYDLRVQTQPSLYGEHVVIRLLPQSGRAIGIDQLGLSPHIAGHYRRMLDNPSGLVLIVGPTGSGKSTTLSAGLQALADDGRRKVITVEDPVEYAIDNIQQTRVRANIGFNFADAMRSFVRQDPDVILVGEIRDAETALESARASQTGHLVLSTLHCNDAVDAVQRLYDLGLHPNSIAGELSAVLAQRLAKRICTHCREQVEPEPEIIKELFPDEVPANFRAYRGKGCDKCSQRGTHGRVAVVEFLRVNADFRDYISRQPSLGELRWRALDAGLVTMRDSAIELVVQGVIPLSELPRILQAERMAPEKRGQVSVL